MAIQLKTKPGINGANVLSIPKDWDATWFRKFLNNSLKGADVRNAIGLNGVTVTGNIASPYATISGGGSPFVAPIVINSTAGQVSLTVNGASGQSSGIFNGPVVINDASGPFALVVNGDGTDNTVQLNTPSGRFTGIALQKAGVTEAEMFFDTTVNELVLASDAAASTFRIRTGVSALIFNNAGQMSLPSVTVTSTAPVAGGAGALPATPAGYMAVTIAGVARRIPFYT
jgi:hypothetical protein